MVKIKHYLIASETNDYRPFITSSTALVYFTVIVWALRIILPVSISFAQTYIDVDNIMERINNERSSRYVSTLTTNSKLTTAAQGKANDMLARSYFSHIDPDGNYVWPRIESAGYLPYSTLGENLAMDFTSASELVAAWMNSPTHRANLLNPQFQDQGLAESNGKYEPGHDTTIVVSLFGRLTKNTNTPAESPSGSNTNASGGGMTIGSNQQISVTQVSGHNLIDISVPITGNPTLVTARLLTQSITLLPQKDSNKFDGTFTFNLSDQLNGEKINVEARNAAGQKASASISLANIQTLPDTSTETSNPATLAGVMRVPVSQPAEIMKILRIIFGILSIIYLGFLVTDLIIIHRNRIERPGLHLAPQIVVFIIVAFVNLFAKF